MSPNEQTPPLAVTPQEAQAMPEATRNAVRAAYAPHYPPAEIERVFGATGAPAPQVQQPNVYSVPGSNMQIIPGAGSDLSREQNISLAKTMLANGADVNAVLAAAEASGITRADLEVAPADPAAVAAQQREAATNDALSAPASPLEYELRYPDDAAKALDMENLAAFDREVKSAFYSGGVPRSLAQGLLTAIIATANSYPPDMSADARKLRFIEEGHRLKTLSNSDGTEVARLATKAYQALPKDFRELVDQQFGWHSAEAQCALSAVGQVLEFRAQRKGAKQ